MEDIFPIWQIEQDCLLNRDGSITIGYTVTLPEVFTLSESDYHSMHYAWVNAVRILPENTILHKQDWFMEANYTAIFDDKSLLSHASERHFNERSFLDHQCFIFFTLLPRAHNNGYFSGSLFSKNLLPGVTLEEKSIDAFMDKVSQALRIVEECRLCSFVRLTANDLISTSETSGLLEKYCMFVRTAETRVGGDIQFGNKLSAAGKPMQVFSLGDAEHLPDLCSPDLPEPKYSTDTTKFTAGFATPLGIMLPGSHIYNQYISVGNIDKILRDLESRRLRLQSVSLYSRENENSRDAVSQFLNEAISLGRLPVKAHFNIISSGDPKVNRNNVAAAMTKMGAKVKQETEAAPQLFWAGIPGNASSLPAPETFLCFAEQACCFLNMETNYRTSLSPTGLRLGERINGVPVHVDLSDEPISKGITTNRNKFILGPSGSGKSFFTNHLIRSYVEQGSHALIVDVGHSYRGLCDLLGGRYFTYSETKPISFNPFYIEGKPDTEKKESIKTLLLALWKKDDESFSRSEYVALSNALDGYYNSTPPFRCFNSFYEYLKDDFTLQLNQDGVKEKEFDIANLLYVLRPYYKGGTYDFLLNAKENLDLLDQPLIVFELDTIKDHPVLFPVVTLILMELFIAKLRKLKGIRKIILIEEAWKAIARTGMAEFIKFLFKAVRKYFGEAIVVTQDIDDIISSPIVKDTIINNSDCKILLDQSKYVNKFDIVQGLLGLTDKEKTLVLSLNKANDPARKYKEVFVSLGGTYAKVYRTEVSMEEYLAYTTEEKEKVLVNTYAQKYGSLKEGIKHLAHHLKSA